MAHIGPLNTRLRIMKLVVSQDATYGTQTETWVPLCECWANRLDVMPSRDESLLGGALEVSSTKIRFRFRWRDAVESGMRVILLGGIERTMEIIGGPSEISGRKAFMEILCEDVTSDG